MDYNFVKDNPLLKQHVIYCGRHAVLRDPDLTKTRVLISINDTVAEMRQIAELLANNPLNVYQFCFLDVEAGDVGAMDLSTAKSIVQYIEDCKDSNFLVHCFAGASRSAAVAKFIVEYLQLDDQGTANLKHYNKHVYNMLKSIVLE